MRLHLNLNLTYTEAVLLLLRSRMACLVAFSAYSDPRYAAAHSVSTLSQRRIQQRHFLRVFLRVCRSAVVHTLLPPPLPLCPMNTLYQRFSLNILQNCEYRLIWVKTWYTQHVWSLEITIQQEVSSLRHFYYQNMFSNKRNSCSRTKNRWLDRQL